MLTQRDKNILPGGRDHETAMRLLNEPGAVLQWRNPKINNPCWSDWAPLCPTPFREDIEWRIKPKTLRYRVGKFAFRPGNVQLCIVESEGGEDYWKDHPDFIDWIADWQEVEV